MTRENINGHLDTKVPVPMSQFHSFFFSVLNIRQRYDRSSSDTLDPIGITSNKQQIDWHVQDISVV